MLIQRKFKLEREEKQAFFPKAPNLTSQIEKNARDHAIQITSSWAKSIYILRIKSVISKLKKSGEITDEMARKLYSIGKHSIDRPKGIITGSDINVYLTLLDNHGGRVPAIRDTLPMRLSEMTSTLEDPTETTTASFWLRCSTLVSRKSVWLPLSGNPYVSKADEVSKGILARKKNGRWRFEVVEKKEWVVPSPEDLPKDAPRIGIDVGFNVIAAASNGDLYGVEFKPAFNRLYQKVQRVRANRQKQGFKENSPRLDRLESRLSGMTRTIVGNTANRLVRQHPDTVFVLEDMNLSGCSGQKRFAYRALARSLACKVPVTVTNPAYTSQECPSCGYVGKYNRKGIEFVCRCCGRQAHADWVGSFNTLRRSEDKGIGLEDSPKAVKRTLTMRFLARRRAGTSGSGSSEVGVNELLLCSRGLTTRASPLGGTGGGSNLISTRFPENGIKG